VGNGVGSPDCRASCGGSKGTKGARASSASPWEGFQDLDELMALGHRQRREQPLIGLLGRSARLLQQLFARRGEHHGHLAPVEFGHLALDQSPFFQALAHAHDGDLVEGQRARQTGLVQARFARQDREHAVLGRGQTDAGAGVLEHRRRNLVGAAQQEARSLVQIFQGHEGCSKTRDFTNGRQPPTACILVGMLTIGDLP
jgi:hypothetical protein